MPSSPCKKNAPTTAPSAGLGACGLRKAAFGLRWAVAFVADFRVSFFFNDTATTEIYTLSLHDALPILSRHHADIEADGGYRLRDAGSLNGDRKSTRLNSSHGSISYAVFCLKHKNERLNSSYAINSYSVFCLPMTQARV